GGISNQLFSSSCKSLTVASTILYIGTQCGINGATRKITTGSKLSVVPGDGSLETEWLILVAGIFGDLLERVGERSRITLEKGYACQSEIEPRTFLVLR